MLSSSSSRIYCKNRHVLVQEPDEASAARQPERVDFHGRDVAVPRGHQAQPGGLFLLNTDALVCSRTCHEVVVVASGVPGLAPGDRVIVFLGGDTAGEAAANGVSAYVRVDGRERWVVHEAFVWARVRDGEVLPCHHVVLTERNDAAFKRHALGPSSLLLPPDAQLTGGMRATGDESDQVLAPVTALYETVVRTGPAVPSTALARGDVVCFSPSYSATRLQRRVGAETRYYHLVDSREAYFTVADG